MCGVCVRDLCISFTSGLIYISELSRNPCKSAAFHFTVFTRNRNNEGAVLCSPVSLVAGFVFFFFSFSFCITLYIVFVNAAEHRGIKRAEVHLNSDGKTGRAQ